MSAPSLTHSSAKGFLLLTLPNCTLTTPSTGAQTGLLALQCVTLDIPSRYDTGRDVWLVLKLNSFEMIISPTQRINYSRSMHTYMFLPEFESAGLVQLIVPLDPSNPASALDLETMEVILCQYGVLYDFEGSSPDKPKDGYLEKSANNDASNDPGTSIGTSDFKGRLVLVDEKDGGIVATLDEAVPIREDKTLIAKGHEKDPVVIDIPDEAEDHPGHIGAFAYPAGPEERDLLMQTAGLISRGIVSATSMITTSLNTASNYYISHSRSSQRPIVFSPRTRKNMRHLHKVSGTAVTVSSKTVGAILETLDYVAGRLSDTGQHGDRHGQLTPSPLPSRSNWHVQSMPGGPVPGGPVPSGPVPGSARPLPPREPRLSNRLLASADLIFTTLAHSAKEIIETGTEAVSASLGHRYGQDAGDASRSAGQVVHNVVLVYIDMRGVGRRALLKRAGRAVVSARMGGRDVMFGTPEQGMPMVNMVVPHTVSPSGVQPVVLPQNVLR